MQEQVYALLASAQYDELFALWTEKDDTIRRLELAYQQVRRQNQMGLLTISEYNDQMEVILRLILDYVQQPQSGIPGPGKA